VEEVREAPAFLDGNGRIRSGSTPSYGRDEIDHEEWCGSIDRLRSY